MTSMTHNLHNSYDYEYVTVDVHAEITDDTNIVTMSVLSIINYFSMLLYVYYTSGVQVISVTIAIGARGVWTFYFQGDCSNLVICNVSSEVMINDVKLAYDMAWLLI